MEHYIFFAFGIIISCLINSIIIFQFIEERYERVYENKWMYRITQIGTCIFLMIINSLEIPILNMLSWIFLFAMIVSFLYIERGKHFFQRIVEVIVLILVLSICETVGFLMLEFILWKLGIAHIPPAMLQCLNMTFSKMVIIILYYFVISRIWKPRKQNKFTMTQYAVYGIIIAYSLVNLSVIIIVISKEMAISFTERLLLLINMFCIVFADLYFIYFTKFTEENSQLKLKLRLLEQQSDLQYEYYAAQEEKYNESVKILHDVNKHLDMIKGMYEQGSAEDATKYANEINKILQPLILHGYTNNPILNILLNDKRRYASLHDIQFQMEIGNIDLNFMKPVDITTVFGNLLDNAIEACDLVTDRTKRIDMKLDTYNEIVVISISNTSPGAKKWANGKPITNKGSHHGIGLVNVENVIRNYDGSMLLEEQDGYFTCKIILNS